MVFRDPTRNEMMRFLRKRYEKLMPESYPEALMDTILIAIWWFANDYHGGQGTNLYKALCAIPYKPGPMMTLEKEDETVEMMYDDLADEYASAGNLSAIGDTGYNPLTKEQIDIVVEMAKQEKIRNSATRILINGQAMNVTTGEVASRGSNVMYHPVYWDLNREAAKMMQQFVQDNNPGKRVTMDYQTP